MTAGIHGPAKKPISGKKRQNRLSLQIDCHASRPFGKNATPCLSSNPVMQLIPPPFSPWIQKLVVIATTSSDTTDRIT
ncbi:hypothetical protein [Paraburkholderia fungorum]|uniref:hypothetical protein n=1 Tax=Paraburkholderia fungorum TaxID=134537 RepID=UPI00248ED1C0|nr:hypothetical protein [Paraburkholderia fungorum]